MVLSQGAFNPPVLTIEKSSHRLLLFSLGEQKSISTHTSEMASTQWSFH
jgi:hypothetical protein